mmetsp:Transcript_40288/g.84600  ORF Transcript_40288/g.84600 Transcript_40288/m.84600 type:complete len:439 (-) Transcript_40288:192-1508(-)
MTLHTALSILIGLLFHNHHALAFVKPGFGPTARPLLSTVGPRDPHTTIQYTSWTPQDLTSNDPGYPPIPDDDYIHKYQSNPQLWPVEFFVIAHRKRNNEVTQRLETQILVRKSANGTSKYGLGTGVPVTRWMPSPPSSSSEASPPTGYRFSKEPRITFDARNYPEFPNDAKESWTYTKIDICEDAFRGSKELEDPELENYATKIREELRNTLSNKIQSGEMESSSWESSTNAIVNTILDRTNSVAAIQGTLRMSGLFSKRTKDKDESSSKNNPRYVSLENDAPSPASLAQSARIYTMFPQMPDPMPLPSTSAQELKEEIVTRPSRMAESGRDPHKDRYGRVYTHISTSNVSNTIHGVYFTIDATNFSFLRNDNADDDDLVPPALDLFGTKEIEREWVSLEDLDVLEEDGRTIGTVDTKPTFISGFIVRQLVKEGVIEV